METINKTFEDIISDAKIIADRRTKVFNDLKKHLIQNIIPSYAELLKRYDIRYTSFALHNRPFENFTAHSDYEGDEDKYYIIITEDGEIREGYNSYGYIEMKKDIYDPDGLSRKCLIQLCTLIKEKADMLNKKYENINKRAESIINDLLI